MILHCLNWMLRMLYSCLIYVNLEVEQVWMRVEYKTNVKHIRDLV